MYWTMLIRYCIMRFVWHVCLSLLRKQVDDLLWLQNLSFPHQEPNFYSFLLISVPMWSFLPVKCWDERRCEVSDILRWNVKPTFYGNHALLISSPTLVNCSTRLNYYCQIIRRGVGTKVREAVNTRFWGCRFHESLYHSCSWGVESKVTAHPRSGWGGGGGSK